MVASTEVAPEAPEQMSASAEQVVPVEFVIDGFRISAEIRHPGMPRRLVDYLNSVDGARINLHNAGIGESAAEFAAAQIHRDAILIAIPRGNTEFTARTIEVVPKKGVLAVIVLPGYDVRGNVFMLPDVDPANTPLIGNRHFMPMTDATITPAGAPDRAWQEPLVVVNLARTLLYAPK